MPPNESRLSCGAELEGSQGEFYHTASKTFSGSIGDGRRQLQALVRLRTTSHSSGPSLSLSRRSTHRPCPGRLTCDAEWTDAPNRPGVPPPARNGTFTWKSALNRTEPPRRMSASTRSRPRGCSQKDLVWGELRSL